MQLDDLTWNQHQSERSIIIVIIFMQNKSKRFKAWQHFMSKLLLYMHLNRGAFYLLGASHIHRKCIFIQLAAIKLYLTCVWSQKGNRFTVLVIVFLRSHW